MNDSGDRTFSFSRIFVPLKEKIFDKSNSLKKKMIFKKELTISTAKAVTFYVIKNGIFKIKTALNDLLI